MRKCFLIFVVMVFGSNNYCSFAQVPWKILEKYECLSVIVYNTEDDTYIDDEYNNAIVTYSQINGTQKSS
jgi:hypothetical protein